MKAVLLRTGSFPVQPSFLPGSPRISLPVHESVAGMFNNSASPKILLHFESSRRRSIRRALSDSDMLRSETEFSGGLSGLSGDRGGVGSVRSFDRSSSATNWPESGIPEELGFSGGGIGKGRSSDGGGGGDSCGTGTFTGGNADRSKIGEYYREMLKSNPTDSLLLRNYGKFLHEVERDTVKAEEYYGRSILANPEDGEVLSLYGNLIWETQRDEDRAQSYFDQSIQASPNDCMVLGSYAHFMWEAEEEDETMPLAVAA